VRTIKPKTSQDNTQQVASQQTTAGLEKRKRSILQCETLETHEQKLTRIGNAFVAWCRKIRASEQKSRNKWNYTLDDFRREHNLTKAEWDNYHQDHKHFVDILVDGKEAIASHMFSGSVEKIFEAGQVNRDLWKWSDEYKANDKYIADQKIALAKEGVQEGSNTTIVNVGGRSYSANAKVKNDQ
jgi:hypothetical protein